MISDLEGDGVINAEISTRIYVKIVVIVDIVVIVNTICN